MKQRFPTAPPEITFPDRREDIKESLDEEEIRAELLNQTLIHLDEIRKNITKMIEGKHDH